METRLTSDCCTCTPGMGFVPITFKACTCAWPPPMNTRLRTSTWFID